jgi:hypothetical protein
VPSLFGRIQSYFARRHLIDQGGGAEDTIMLAGSGRSGTTWVSEVIDYRGDLRTIFEPLHPVHVPEFEAFGWCKYLRADGANARFLAPVRDVIEGHVRGEWVDGQNRRFLAKKRLIKIIRGNLLLPWLLKKFPELKIVMLVRHPAAVALSIQRLKWPTSMNTYLDQPELMFDHLTPFESKLRAVSDPFEKNIFAWCIQQLVPLRDLAPGQVHPVFYESLCLDPRAEIKAMFDFLGQAYDDTVLDALQRPSQVAQTTSAVNTGGDLLNTWRKHVTDEQVAASNRILKLFGLHGLYGEDSVPQLTGKALFEAF